MKTLIIYATKHGCTEKCANKLKNNLPGDIDMVNLQDKRDFGLADYDKIIVGGSIHMGKVQKAVKDFCEHNADVLNQKKLGLYLCCMEEGEAANKQFNEAFPDDLIAHASATGIFGGEYNLEKMNFIERFMIKRIAKTDKSVSKISEDQIIKFAESIM